MAAVAIYNSQQLADLDRRRREAEQLEEIGRALTGKLNPDQVVSLVISAVSDVLDVDGVAIWLKDPRKVGMFSVADSGGEIVLPIGLDRVGARWRATRPARRSERARDAGQPSQL